VNGENNPSAPQSTDGRFARPTPVDDIDLQFGGKIDQLLPRWDEIPEEFVRHWHWNDHPWCGPINEWFHKGLDDKQFTPKAGIDAQVAWRHMGACMRSWAPKHEHKIAGCGYLLSLWFDKVPS